MTAPVKIIRVADLPWEHKVSPGGRFERHQREISAAQDCGPTSMAPFDLAQVRLPAGKMNFPAHRHATQWEAYHILRGAGVHEAGGKEYPVRAGDAYTIPPGIAHRMHNTGTEEMEYLVIANNPPLDAIYYPKTGKWMLKPERLVFTMTEADYFEGEE